jgi:hypothetical protein
VVSLIPTRGGNGALERLRDTGEFAPPRLGALERALEQALDLRRSDAAIGRVFADTWDLERFSECSACLEKRRQRLLAMNFSQRIFSQVDCHICGGA